jgi:hypothetical protein
MRLCSRHTPALQHSRQVGLATRVGIANSIYHRSLPCGQKMQSLRVLRPLGCRTGPLALLYSDVSAPNALPTLYMRLSTRCTVDQRFRSLTHVQLGSFNTKIIFAEEFICDCMTRFFEFNYYLLLQCHATQRCIPFRSSMMFQPSNAATEA